MSPDELRTWQVQVLVAFGFAAFWMITLEAISQPLYRYIPQCEWWPRAAANHKTVMINFGHPKEDITEDAVVFGFSWIITMCITHIVSGSLMFPVVLHGWQVAGAAGQTSFLLGVSSEIGFDVYDWLKNFLLTFCHKKFSFWGPLGSKRLFVVVCVIHHCTVLLLAIPMNLKYAHLPSYHHLMFSFLLSAGVCCLSGHYKFTLDASTPRGLFTCKLIVAIQLVMNWVTRVFIFAHGAYHLLSTFHTAGDVVFFRVAIGGTFLMGCYNVLVIMDSTTAAIKWSKKTHKE